MNSHRTLLSIVVLGSTALISPSYVYSGEQSPKAAVQVETLMQPSEIEASGIAKLTKAQLAFLNQWLTRYSLALLQRAHGNQEVTEEAQKSLVATMNIEGLDNARLIGDDGRFLGKITTNPYDTDSIGNEYGEYGNKFNINSIFNEFGTYGGKYSALSPFNRYTNTPPKIVLGTKVIGFLSVNSSISNRLDPFVLIAWIKGKG
jgi:hypothetical protein